MADKTRRRIPLAPTCAQPHTCPLPVRLHVLSRAPLFHGLDEEELRGIDARMVSLAWAEGDPLYGEGDPAEHLYVLASGRAKATRTQRDGQVAVVDLLASIHRCAGSAGRAWESENALLIWENTTCLRSVLPVQEGHLVDATLSHPPGGVRIL